MPPVGFEPAISAGERLQTYALDPAATGIGLLGLVVVSNLLFNSKLDSGSTFETVRA